MQKYSIEIDCYPGFPRPGDLLPGVLKETGVTLGQPNSTLFGNWTWLIPEEQVTQYELNRETIKNRITQLYHDGHIRYGSW